LILLTRLVTSTVKALLAGSGHAFVERGARDDSVDQFAVLPDR
jgi:hypothetical protein